MFLPVDSLPDKRIIQLAAVQFLLYFSTWLVGIYINGFEPSPADVGGSSVIFFLSPPVITHVVLGASTAAVGIALLIIGWIYKFRKFVLLSGLSLASISIAGTGGLSYVFGVGNSDLNSMIMAGSFITAVYLTFIAILNTGLVRRIQVKKDTGLLRNFSIVTLTLFYLVFVSGMYLNLFVASAIFSKPPEIARQMLGQMVTTPTALIHEFSGGVLLASVISFTLVLFSKGLKRLAVRGVVVTLLVTYSLLLGVIENIEPATNAVFNPQAGLESLMISEIAPLLSAAGFFVAILISMSIVLRLRSAGSPDQR
ncbi:MAG TPA: hypothetical protein VNE86_05445 [Nitrososphaerales archaeon]|nr:hypothetical protein [Nitrososphaerales archaeon]